MFDTADRIEVHMRQALPAGTRGSALLSGDGRAGNDPDWLDVLPVAFAIERDLPR